MPDVEKVIKGLECCSSAEECGKQCPYWNDKGACRTHLEADALALLKAQEPVVMAGAELTDAELIEAIRKAPLILKPTVDAVPVVRCKDCMYFRPWRHDRGEDSRCEFWNTEMGAEDYCSQAIYLNNGRNDNGKDA